MTERLTDRDELIASITATIRNVVALKGEPVEIMLCEDYYDILDRGRHPTDLMARHEPMRLHGLLCTAERHIENFVVRFTKDDRTDEAAA